MQAYKKVMTLLAVGAALYSAIEILWRGFTHWTMALTGGLCLCGIYYTNEKLTCKSSTKCVFCSLFITVVEFTAGVILNLKLHMRIWDYSRLPFNLLGQICLLYSFFWFLLSFPALRLCNYIKENFFS